jgi:all-trans-retinol dehydrogenase (NAD+)
MLRSIAGHELTGSSVVHPAYVRTPMLEENMQSDQWRKKGHYMIEPETVADAIVKQLHSGMGAQLVLPERYWLATGVRGWPSWMQEVMRNSMKDELIFLGGEGKNRKGRA